MPLLFLLDWWIWNWNSRHGPNQIWTSKAEITPQPENMCLLKITKDFFWSQTWALILLMEELLFNTIQWLQPTRWLTCSVLVILQLIDQTLEPLMWITSCTMSWSFVKSSVFRKAFRIIQWTLLPFLCLFWSVCQYAAFLEKSTNTVLIGSGNPSVRRTKFQCCCLKLKPQNDLSQDFSTGGDKNDWRGVLWEERQQSASNMSLIYLSQWSGGWLNLGATDHFHRSTTCSFSCWTLKY